MYDTGKVIKVGKPRFFRQTPLQQRLMKAPEAVENLSKCLPCLLGLPSCLIVLAGATAPVIPTAPTVLPPPVPVLRRRRTRLGASLSLGALLVLVGLTREGISKIRSNFCLKSHAWRARYALLLVLQLYHTLPGMWCFLFFTVLFCILKLGLSPDMYDSVVSTPRWFVRVTTLLVLL